MKSVCPIQRRVVLKMTLGAAGLCFFPIPALAAQKMRRSEHSDLFVELGHIVNCSSSAAIIGAEYLKAEPQEADPDLLVREIFSDVMPSLHINSVTADDILNAIRNKHRDDFRSGRICKLQGWMLSETELKLCASTYIIQRERTTTGLTVSGPA